MDLGSPPAVTLAVRVIPCLDVDAGRVVKGVNFEGLRDAGDPVALARFYDAEGADELVFLDITASSGDRETTYDVVRRTADEVFIPLTVGGGVRSPDDFDRLLRAGADKVSLSTAAVRTPDLIDEAARLFGSQCVVLSVDTRRSTRTPSGFEVTTHGGREDTDRDTIAWVREATDRGVGEILLNSMDADGTRSGLTSTSSHECARPSMCPSLPAAARGVLSTSSPRCWPGPTPSWQRASSTSVTCPSLR